MEKKGTKIFLVMAMVAMLLVAVSCSEQVPSQKLVDPNGNGNETAPEDAVAVSLVIDEDKTLSSAINRDIEYWEFMATPKFEMANGEKIWGQVSYWRVLNEMDTSTTGVKTTANLGKYTSGDWYFEVRALNSEKHVIYVGSHQQVIRAGLDNTVHITMLTDRADGTHGESADATSTVTGATGDKSTGSETIAQYGSLHVGIELNKLDLDPANVDIVTYRQAVGKNSVMTQPELVNGITWTKKGAGEKFSRWYTEANTDNYRTIPNGVDGSQTIGTARAYYECIIPNLDAGPYVYTFYVYAKNTSGTKIPIAGQAVEVMIMGNEETQVKGTLLANEYVQTKLVLDQTGEIFGSINNRTYMTVNAENTAELTFMQSASQIEASKESAVKYFWIGDGEYLTPNGQDSNVYVYSCPVNENGKPAYGLHRVAVVVFGEQGSTGCATIDLIFNPESGPGNYEDIEWPPEYIRP